MIGENRSLTSLNDTWADISAWLEWWLETPRLTSDKQAILEKYYSSYRKNFSPYIKKYYSKQTEDFLQLISKINRPRALEVGCGCGTESLWFAMAGAEVLGVDLSDARLAVARERSDYLKRNSFNINVIFQNLNLFDIKPDKEFDVIWMEQAFHHIEPRADVPGKLFELLKPGGYVVISEANGWNPFIQFQLFRKRGLRTVKTLTDCNGKEHSYGNERVTIVKFIDRLFKDSGFKIESVKYFRMLPNIKNIDNFSWIESLVPKWFVPAFTHFNIVMRKSA